MKVLKHCGSTSFGLYRWGMSGIRRRERGIMFALPYRAKEERRKTVKFPLSWACEESLNQSLEPSTLYAPPPPLGSLLHQVPRSADPGKDAGYVRFLENGRSFAAALRSAQTTSLPLKFGSQVRLRLNCNRRISLVDALLDITTATTRRTPLSIENA